MLAAVILTLDHNARWNVGEPYCRVGFIDVLTTGARSAVGIGSNVGWIDVNLNRVIDFRINVDAGKGGVATAR